MTRKALIVALAAFMLYAQPVYADQEAESTEEITQGYLEETEGITAVATETNVEDVPWEGLPIEVATAGQTEARTRVYTVEINNLGEDFTNPKLFVFVRDLKSNEIRPVYLYKGYGYRASISELENGSGYYVVYAGNYGWRDAKDQMWSFNGNEPYYFYTGSEEDFDATLYNYNFEHTNVISLSMVEYEMEMFTKGPDYAMNKIVHSISSDNEDANYRPDDLVYAQPGDNGETSAAYDASSEDNTSDDVDVEEEKPRRNPFMVFFDAIKTMVLGHLFLIGAVVALFIALYFVQKRKGKLLEQAKMKNENDDDIID